MKAKIAAAVKKAMSRSVEGIRRLQDGSDATGAGTATRGAACGFPGEAREV
jgi:hypothetical protein